MADRDSFLDIGNFNPGQAPSSSIDLSTPTTAQPDFVNTVRSVRDAKVESVRQSKLAKAMTLGSDDFMRTMATAAEEGNRIAQEPAAIDMRTMNRLQIADKYGEDVANNRERYFEQRDQIREDKDTDQTWGDFGRSGVSALANFAGSIVQPATVIGEELQLRGRQGINLLAGEEVLPETRNIPGTDTSTSLAISGSLEEFNKYLDGFDSEATQRNEAQMAREQMLDAADSLATREEAIEKGLPEWKADTQQFVRDAVNTAKNVADNPTSAERLAVEGAAMLVPFAGASRGAGYALAIKDLSKKGMSPDGITKFLATQEGKDFVKTKAAAAVPAISGAVGGGAAVNQAQQAAMSLTDAELQAHPDYAQMVKDGLSKDDMRKQIAGDASLPAGAIGGGIGALTGMIAPKFEADPLAAVRGKGTLGSSAASAALSTGKETVEEFIQGGGETLGSNIGINLAGVDQDITEGLAEAATLEGLGGAMVSGGIKAPGAALGTLKETGSLAVSGAKKVADAQEARVARKDDAASPVGSKVQTEQADTARTAATTLTQSTPDQSEAEQTIAKTIAAASFLPPEEAEQMAQFSEGLNKVYTETGKIDRHTVINELAQGLMSKETPADQKIGLSMGILEAYEQSQANDSDELRSALEALPEDAPARAELQKVWDAAGILGQSKVIAEAKAQMQNLTPETVSGMLDVEAVLKGDVNTPEAQNTLKAMELIGRYNPAAIDLEKYDLVLNQVKKGLKKNPALAKSLATTRSLVAEMQEADKRKAEIEAAQDAVVEGLTEEQKKQGHGKYHARSEVRKDILERGNSYTDGKSLLQHREEFETARIAGRFTEAKTALEELGNFARSQINKLNAYNQSAENGQGRAARIAFPAYNAKLGKFFAQDENKVWVDTGSSESVAMAMDAHVDTSMLVNLYNTLAQNYGDQIGEVEPMKLPDLHPKIAFTKPTETTQQAEASPATEKAPAVEAEQTTPTQTEPVDVIEDVEEDLQVTEEFEEDIEVAEAPSIDLETPAETEAVTEPAPVEKAKPKTLAESLPNLVQDADGRNRLTESFDRRPDGAKTLDMEKPAQEVAENIDTYAQDESNDVKPLAPAQKQTLTNIVETHIPNLIQAFRDRLAPRKADLSEAELKLSKKVQRWLGELDQKGKKTLSYKDALPLNFLSQEEDGTVQLEPRIMDAVAMSAVEAMVEMTQRTVPNLDDEDIRSRLKLPSDAQVTQGMRDVVRSGMHVQSLLDTIDRKTQRLLGLTPKQGTPQNLTQGLFRSMAANMVEIMEENGWIQVDPGYYKVGEDVRQYPVIRKGDSKDALDIIEGMRGQPDIFTRALVPGSAPTRYVGKPPSRVGETQKNNRFAETSEKEQQAIDRLQKTPFKFNMPLLDELMELGDDVVFRLFGGKDVDETSTNKQHAESIKGRNSSIRSGWDGVMGYHTEAEQTGEEVGAIPLFFEWFISSTGRLFQRGPVTPQANKIARALMTATNSTLDLTTEQDQKRLWLGVAQALDISIDKKNHDEAIAEAKELTKSMLGYAPVVAILERHLDGDEITDEDRTDLVDFMQNAYDADGNIMESTPVAFHALMTVARANLAQRKGTAEAFETSLSLEADGVTDGPINAMVHMMTGAFDSFGEQVKILAKGGWYFSDQKMSRNDYITQDKEDLYHKAAEILRQNLREMLNNKPDANAIRLLNVLEAFSNDFGMSADQATGSIDVEIGRNITKNPLTTFLYGAGVEGITQKIVDGIKGQFYELMTEVAQQTADGVIKSWRDHPKFAGNGQLVEDMAAALDMNQKALERLMDDPVNAEIPAAAERNLLGGLQGNFGDPLVDAIDEATGGLKAAMETTQLASNMQAIVFQDIFKRLAAEKHAELGLEKSEILSQNDMQDVFREAMKVAPIYETDAQTFHISSQEGYDSDTRIASSLNDRTSSGATLPQAGKAGVKVSPYMTIGTGDGRMILNIYADADGALSTSLPVFDGVELALDQIESGSQQVNQGVFKGWTQGNIYRTMQESMDNTLLNLDMNTLSEETMKQLNGLLKRSGREDELFTRETLEGMRDQLRNMADMNQARKEAMMSLKSWVDHMAGADSPSEHDGEAIIHEETYNVEKISQRLNELYHEKLAQIKAKHTEANQAPAVQEPDATIQALLDIAGEEVPGHEGVKKVSGQKIFAFIREQTGFSKDQFKLFWEVLAKDPSVAQGQFFFGSQKDLEAMRDDALPNMPKAPLEAGQHWVGGNVSLIANATSETLLHEILHAHTAKTLVDHYSNPEASSPHVKDAVARLEGLMSDFQALNTQSENQNTKEAVSTLKSELTGLSGNPAAQMSEFISWTLSNQNLLNLTKRSKTYSPLQKIGRKTLHLLKRMLGITTEARSDLFSKIRFNTEILGAEPVREGKTKAETDYILNQAFGSNARINEIEARFTDRLLERLQSQRNPNDPDQTNDLNRHVDRVDRLQQSATKAAEMVHAQGFFMNPRQREAFKAVHMAMMSGMQLNPAALRQANRAYRHAIRTLKVEDFQENPENVSAREDTLANMQFDAVTGKAGLRETADGRTDLLATFMALSLVSPTMQEVVAKLDPPKDVEGFNGTFDGFLEGTANTAINGMTRAAISPRGMGKDMAQQLDILADALSRSQGERRIMATEQKLMQPVEWSNEKASNALGNVSEKVSDYFKEKATASTNKVGVIGYTAASIITAFGSKEASTARGEAFSEMLNAANGFHETRALLGDLRGMSGANAPLMRMINKVKSQIDAMRQNYRETIPRELADKFSRKITKAEASRLHQGIGQTDFPSLGITDAMRLATNPGDVDFYVNAEMERITAIDPKNATLYRTKANHLAQWMTKREVITDNLLRNADAIAGLFGEKTKGTVDPTPELVTAIDKLVSLLAYGKLDDATKETIKELAETETEGLRTLITYQETTKRIEDLKAPTGEQAGIAQLNRWKGYIPASNAPGSDVTVEDDSKEAEMARKGYVRVGTYQGDGTERYRGKRGIYRTSVGGKNTFRQGVAQTVHETYHGIDVRTGKSQTGDMAGMIYGKAARGITALRKTSPGDLAPGEYLMPLRDAEGTVVGYERPLPAKTIQSMDRDTNLFRMLGAWSGRVLEERASNRFNREFVETMKEIRDGEYNTKGKARADKEFVNIADPEIADPVIRDAWATMGWRLKSDAADIFGRENYFPVRKDMIKDAIGYRAASITDPFTGTTRLDEKTQKAITKTMETILGRNAFKWLKQGENTLQTGVSYAKETIIIRSVVVPVGNMVSNMLHLMIHGVGPLKMATAMRDKFLEVQQYVKNQEEVLRLNIELSADPDNKRLQRELASIEDVNANLSIAPLIEAGEFSTISENLTAEDTAIREGGLADWIEAAVDKLPGSARTVGKNLVITKDTALYRGLNRSVQYGDFIAKAVLFDHMTEKGVAHDEIMDTLAEEFVNYNRLSGRGRDFLESMGLLWFFNYKLRIQKVLMNTARERPVSFALMAGGLGPALDIDTVLSGSGVGSWWDGRMGFAVGPEMGLNAASLNPWWQMTN